MKNRFLAAAACLMAAVLLLSGCSAKERYYGGVSERTDSDMSAYTADILPQSQDNAYGDRVTATLYYRYLSENMLAGIVSNIAMHSSADSNISAHFFIRYPLLFCFGVRIV